MEICAADFSVLRMPPKSKWKLHLIKAREFKTSKRQHVDSSNVASTSSELSSDQLLTFEELSFGQPYEPFSSGELSSGQPPISELSSWISHSLLENCLLVNLLHQNFPLLFLIVVI